MEEIQKILEILKDEDFRAILNKHIEYMEEYRKRVRHHLDHSDAKKHIDGLK